MNAHFHIDAPNDNLLNWYVRGISFCTKLLRQLRIKRPNFKWGLITRINKNLYKIYLESEGLKSVLKDVDAKEAKVVHPTVYRILCKHRKLYSVLEKVDFFGNSETKEICENLMTNFYWIERYLRRLAFSGMDKNQDDKNLTEFASTLSLSSLP